MTGRLFLFMMTMIVAAFAQPENIAVLDMDPTGISPTEAQFLSDRLRTELFETGTFQVVERQKMNSILNEQGFQNTGCTSVECAVEIGQLLNVRRMVAGSIGKIEDIYSISLRLIDVQTGAIVKTATNDFKGKLSAVLTEVIPAVARDLSSSVDAPQKKEVESDATPTDIVTTDYAFSNKGFAIYFKGGFTSLGYPTDLSPVQDELSTLSGYSADEIAQHSYFGFELQYGISENWSLKAGVGQINALSGFKPSLDGYDPVNSSLTNLHGDFDRYYIFVNTYIGMNTRIWNPDERSRVFLGIDLGSINLRSGLDEVYKLPDGSNESYDKEYTYSVFALKFSAGYSYRISNHFLLAAELSLQSAGSFDLSDQERKDTFPTELDQLIYPDAVAASGLQLNLMAGYHF